MGQSAVGSGSGWAGDGRGVRYCKYLCGTPTHNQPGTQTNATSQPPNHPPPPKKETHPHTPHTRNCHSHARAASTAPSTRSTSDRSFMSIKREVVRETRPAGGRMGLLGWCFLLCGWGCGVRDGMFGAGGERCFGGGGAHM